MNKTIPQTNEERKAFREKWEDDNLTGQIDCPFEDHKDHKATVYKSGHRYEGLVECSVTDESDSCEHPETHVENIEVDTMRNGEHDTYEVPSYVCDVCDCVADGDPAEDRAEALADMQIMEARGK